MLANCTAHPALYRTTAPTSSSYVTCSSPSVTAAVKRPARECSAILPRHIPGAVVGRWLSIAGLRARAAAPQVGVR